VPEPVEGTGSSMVAELVEAPFLKPEPMYVGEKLILYL
jgi:hypothetical protein